MAKYFNQTLSINLKIYAVKIKSVDELPLALVN